MAYKTFQMFPQTPLPFFIMCKTNPKRITGKIKGGSPLHGVPPWFLITYINNKKISKRRNIEAFGGFK